MTRPSSAQLHQFAREERARRKVAWERAGKAGSDMARQDDVIWSNIVHMTGMAAGEPARSDQPASYNALQRILMARNIWATARKAEASLDMAIAANQAKARSLYQLFRWVRPLGWSPLIQDEEGRAAA